MTGDLRLVVFDLDGTLIDSQHLIVDAMNAAFSGTGHAPPGREAILGIVGLSLPEAMAALCPELDGHETRRLADLYRDQFDRQRALAGEEALAPLYPGAREALDAVAADTGTLLGVATGKAKRGLDHALESHKLSAYFATTQTSDFHPSKPHPSMLETALRETGVDAGRAVMIGDTEYDIEMGHAAGYATIGVAWGYHDADRLHAAGASAVIDDFAELAMAVEALVGVNR